MKDKKPSEVKTMELTEKQRERQQHRENGKYAKVNPCYVCEKSAGVDYYSHPDTDGEINDELLCLCKKCYDKCGHLSGKKAVELMFPPKKQVGIIDVEPTWEALLYQVGRGILKADILLPACQMMDKIRQAQKSGIKGLMVKFPEKNGAVALEEVQ